MLVLGRKPSETIHIGDDITITLVRATDGSARIGIDAPPNLNIWRGELDQHDPTPTPAPARVKAKRNRAA